MEKDLELYLNILNSERCLKKPKEAIVILEKISKCFTQEKSQFTVGLLISLLFNEDNAIFTFIWKMSTEFETVPAVSAAFRLLDYLVTHFQKSTEPYFSVLFKKCLFLINSKFAKVKEVSLKLVKNLIVADSKQSLDLSELVSTLEKHLRKETKISGTVLGHLYSLLGYLFENHPESIKHNEGWFLSKICLSLKEESSSAKGISPGIVKGAFEGINGYLTNYPPPDLEILNIIYNYILNWSKFQEDKKSTSHAALQLLQNHWSHFSNFIYKDKDFWKNNLEVLIKQKKKEDRILAFKFLCAFYSVIALFIKQDSSRSEVCIYLKEFAGILESDSNFFEKKGALVGIKLFVLTGSLEGENLNRALELVVNFIKKHESRKCFCCLPLGLECVSAFLVKFTNQNFYPNQLTFLQKLSVKLIDRYPVEIEFQTDILTALEKSFYTLGRLGSVEILENHINRVLYQGLIRTCSSMTLTEYELLKENGQTFNSTCYKSYFNLWKYLLTLASNPNLPVGGSFAVKKAVAVKVFDAFMNSFLKILLKLNFSVDSKMEVEKPSDLHIFINIVDLYQDLVPLIDPFNLQKWLYEVLRTVIQLSYVNPLVSGFYKITAACLKVADSIQFFDDCTGDRQKCFKLTQKFLEYILVKIDQFRGDLQMACLKVFLAAPAITIEAFAEKTVPALQVIVQLARSSPTLLKDVIETLERWDFFLPSATSNVIMRKILPHFDIFFQSPYFRGNNSVDWSKSGKTIRNQVKFDDSEFLSLQKKFLMFLGNLEISKGMNLIALPDADQTRNITDKNLVCTLPCCSGWVELNLNDIIPRVIDLAENCGDKKTRLIACELLHSMVMVILGNVNQLSGCYTYLFRKVLKTCLVLGCDPDGVVCQIFQPLMYQIVHYFSGKQTLNFSETYDLIDILSDYLTCPYNSIARNFSAVLLREFTVWSIRQLTPEELKITPESVKRILQKIYALALHPSYNKRLGAAVLFNKTYSVLREEDFILDAYWFELFYYFMESLRMCDGPEDVTEITEAIWHVERPIVERSKDFNNDCSYRIVPPEFKGCRLCHLVKWTLERACDVKPIMRRTAMAVVHDLAPLVENCDSNMLFFNKHLHNFFQLKENLLQSNFDLEEFINWLKYQSAGFEYCAWLLEEKVLTTDEVFQPKFKAVLKLFICGILSHNENALHEIAVTNLKQQSILLFLSLLYTLKERAYLFPSEHWELLKTAVFKPSRIGFDLNEASNSEQLLSALTKLLKYFSRHLTAYDWSNLFDNLDSLIIMPTFGCIIKTQYVSMENLDFLFALKVIGGSGMWDIFVEKVFFSMKEDLFIVPIFKSLFFEQDKTMYAANIDPSCKFYLEEVLKILLKVSVDMKSLMLCLENEEEVREEETGKVLKKGEFFQMLFKNVIFNFLESKCSLFVERVLTKADVKGIKLLLQVLENQSGDSDLSVEIFNRWKDFENLDIPDSVQKDKVLLHLALCSARLVGTPGCLKTSPAADKIYNFLESQKYDKMNLSEIETISGLLPYLSGFAEGLDENNRLKVSLFKIQIDLEGLKTSNDSSTLNHVQFALIGILQSLRVTASLVVLNFLLSRATWFSSICQKQDVESALSVFAEGRISLEHSITALELAYDYCFEHPKMACLPSVIYYFFLEPLLRLTSSASVYHLMKKKMTELCNLMTSDCDNDNNSARILRNLTTKICAAKLFQAFITKLSKEELNELPKKKRELMVLMIRNVFFLLKKPYPPLHLREHYRKLMCQIFNMICCIISAICVNEKFYKLFVFDERGNFLFEAIDKNLKYDLRMDFDDIPKRKKHLTTLRKAIAKEGQATSVQNSVKYIKTNTLFTSSLQEDVTRFDLTFSFIRPLSQVPQDTMEYVEIELEMDSLNSHECMATLVATISKMARNQTISVGDVTELPCWLTFFLATLKNADFCENLKLFVLKAIYNVQEFVAPFCHQIFLDLLDSILKIFIDYPINYFLIDLIEMMVGWKHVPEEERSREALTELVKLVLRKSDSLRRDVVKNNLEILKTVIEVWKNALHLPHLSSFVFQRLCSSVEEDLRNSANTDSVTYLNIHACGILLLNGIEPWEGGREKQFFDLILRNFREEYKLSEIFGEICGAALNHIQKTDPGSLGGYEQLVRDKISLLPNCWLQLLYSVHKHHPKISSLFAFRIFSSAWDSTDSLTVKKLEMLLSHVVSGSEITEDSTFDRYVCAFVLDMLNSPDVAVHELSLQIAEKLLHKMDNDKLMLLMREIMRLQKSVYSAVRKWVYEICKQLYGRRSCDYITTQCKVILLRGLSDGVYELEHSCLEFWRSVLSFTDPDTVFLQILHKMYASEAEDVFLSNTARILLQFSSDDYRSVQNIFPHPITHQCKFRKRNLVLGVHQSFLLSLKSPGRTLTNQSLEHMATISHQNLPYLRPVATTLKFQPTLQNDSDETGAPDISTPRDAPVPKNPLKRRFYKTEAKTHLSFVKWSKLNKKKQLEEEEEKNKKKEDVVIYGMYRDGDYPDIQINYLQIMKLLEVLARKDHQIARLFLVSYYSGLVKIVKASEKEAFLSETTTCFENILKSSKNFDPGLFGFLLQVILNHGRDLDIDCQLISNAAVSSNWISLGALIIEQIIASKEGQDSETPKKRFECESAEEKRWLELARLYRSLEEFDVLSGIFLDKLNVLEDAREAIRFESMLNWQEASKHYEAVLRSKRGSIQNEFYTESYLTCLAKLSNWSSLNKCVRATVNNDLNELWSNYNLLSWFLKSEMMISLKGDPKEFRLVLEEFCKKSARENILSTNFEEEMAVFDWFSGNLQKASHRIDRLCLNFLAEWSHLDQWSYNLRAAKLARLQTLSELSFAVRNVAEVSKSQLERSIKEGLKRWEKSVPAPRDDLTIWDVKLGYRREFLRRLRDFDLREVEVKSNLALAKAALNQHNLSMVKECLSRAKEKLPEGNFDLKVEHSICFNMGKMVLARLRMRDHNVGLEVYLNVWNGISKQILSMTKSDSDSSSALAYSRNFILGQLISEILPYVKNQAASAGVLKCLCSILNSSETDIVSALQLKGLEYFEAAENALSKVVCSAETKSNAYLELSKFILKFPDSASFEKLCKSLLKAMRLGNPEARQLFGCLLNTSHVLPEEFSFEDIVPECDRVPSWMFLTWINQMLASLNIKTFPFLRSILLRIAQDYPNAIRYALKITEELKFVDPKTKSFFIRLYGIVSKESLYDDFWMSLKYLASPHLVLRYHLEDALQEASQTEPNYFQIKKIIFYLQGLMFSPNNEKFRGPIFKFWEKFKQPLEDLLKDCENKEVLKGKIRDMLSSIERVSMPSRRMLGLLESYSPWLYNFHALKIDTALELPGQYDGRRQPIKKYLVTMSSFRNSVIIYDSKCRPMRISILGNDASEHKFLVKFGEDLRQDERIQQVFQYFNHRLEESNQTRDFFLSTYKVIPQTLSLGLIEWVENTVSLYEMMENSLGSDSDTIAKVQNAHIAFLSEGLSVPVPVAAHLIAYETIAREKAISSFKTRVQAFPRDLLRKCFLDLSASPEHFMHLRRSFATSHAIMCVTHWLIGIGDRHLQNILVSTKTGRVLGIDFGYAFGFATQFLTPPELLPFRLSPQILNLMRPLGESGWIKQTMVHCFKTFRKESFQLHSVLEVFVQEPVMDWLKQAKKSPNYKTENSDTWHPREKLVLVERKLNGVNPVTVFEADLRAGHSGSRYLEKYLEVLKGCRQDNIRARCAEDGLTEEEQVECLVDLATDPHVLAKTYIGWNPWL